MQLRVLCCASLQTCRRRVLCAVHVLLQRCMHACLLQINDLQVHDQRRHTRAYRYNSAIIDRLCNKSRVSRDIHDHMHIRRTAAAGRWKDGFWVAQAAKCQRYL